MIREYLNLAASVATAIAVIVACWQLAETKKQARLQFEDHLNEQYRALIRGIPVAALLGDRLTDEEHVEALPEFYHYFDLSNEQAFLHESGRVSKAAWANWRDGIEQNLRTPAFTRAWAEIASRAPDSFDELRRLVPPMAPSLLSGSPSLTMVAQSQD